MHFLEKYANYYRDHVHLAHVRLITVGAVVIILPLLKIMGGRLSPYLIFVWLLLCALVELPERKFEVYQGDGDIRLRIRGERIVHRHVGFMGLTGFLYCFSKILFDWGGDPFKYYAKVFGEVVLRATCQERQIRMPLSPIPRKKVIITNHVTRPFMDSLSVFSFVRKDDPIIFLQHNFNKVVTATSKWIWGAYTIDKDDKTYKGKAALEAQLQELVRIMEVTENLTLIVYAQGKVPKTVEETRNPSRFFPGAFYLAMMAGYPVVPLVNDYREGVLVNTCLEPIYLHREYSSRIRHYPLVRRFRRANKPLIDEIGERFVRLFRDQYEVIERDERAAYKTKRDVLYACGKIKN